jgi:hypothetical protein
MGPVVSCCCSLFVTLCVAALFDFITDLIIDLMAKKMSLPVRVASPAPSSGQRAMSLSSNWYGHVLRASGFMPSSYNPLFLLSQVCFCKCQQ